MTVKPVKLPNGNYLVPMRAESQGVIGDSMVELPPDNPDVIRYLEYWSRIEDVIGS
jgi:hypothetical protein